MHRRMAEAKEISSSKQNHGTKLIYPLIEFTLATNQPNFPSTARNCESEISITVFPHLGLGGGEAKSAYIHKLTLGLKVLWLGRTDNLCITWENRQSVPL